MAINVKKGLFSKQLLWGLVLLLVQQTRAAPPPALKTIDVLPSNLSACKANDPKLNDCIKNGLQFVLGNFKSGLPEINIPVMDPFELEKANFQLSNNLLNGKIGLRNLQIKGLSGIQIKDIDYQNKDNMLRLVAKGTVPFIELYGKHKANVDAGNSKIASKGDFDLTLENVDFIATIEGKLDERNGHQYLTATKVDFEPTVGNLQLKATGLLPEPALNDAVVESINQNWQQFYKMLVADAHQTWEPVIIKNLNDFSAHLPFDLLINKA